MLGIFGIFGVLLIRMFDFISQYWCSGVTHGNDFVFSRISKTKLHVLWSFYVFNYWFILVGVFDFQPYITCNGIDIALTLSRSRPWNRSLSSFCSRFLTKYDTGRIPMSLHTCIYLVLPVVSWKSGFFCFRISEKQDLWIWYFGVLLLPWRF